MLIGDGYLYPNLFFSINPLLQQKNLIKSNKIRLTFTCCLQDFEKLPVARAQDHTLKDSTNNTGPNCRVAAANHNQNGTLNQLDAELLNIALDNEVLYQCAYCPNFYFLGQDVSSVLISGISNNYMLDLYLSTLIKKRRCIGYHSKRNL
ncbi:hypothetical protein ACJX0J_041357, partial [Zea mays]